MRLQLKKDDWLFLAVVPAILIDAALTLAGQPVAYWLYDPAAIHEAGPLAGIALALGPLAFAAFVAFWLALVFAAIRLSPYPLNIFFSLFLLLAHTGAADRWMRVILLYGIELKTDTIWWAYRLLDLLMAGWAAFCLWQWKGKEVFKAAGKKNRPR